MSPVVGTPVRRLEGRAKVTGAAEYAVEDRPDGTLVGWPVQAPISRGRVLEVPEDVPGASHILWHANAPKLQEPDDPELFVLQSDEISYRGQVIALVLAPTLAAARAAAQAIEPELELSTEEHDSLLRADHPGLYDPQEVNPTFPSVSEQGTPDEALAQAHTALDETYTTPAEFNNPMEPHGTIAWWDGPDRLVMRDSTQGPSSVAEDVGVAFGLPESSVRVIAEHIGGGFGSKGSARPNAVLAALASQAVGAPVEVALPRQALFSMVGYRTPTIQRVRLGAEQDGTLTTIVHEAVEQTSRLFEFAEQTTEGTRHIYAAPHRRTTHKLARLDVPTPRWMRAPGEAPGSFAMECAMDELAHRLGVDPVTLRIRNEPSAEPESGKPFTKRNLVACLREGASRFGWSERDPRPGVRREGRFLRGTGVASAWYPVNVMPTTARVRLEADGRVVAMLGAADIGTGARTVLTQIVADEMGVDLDHVELFLGDSSLPHASVAGGSSGTGSWGWALALACDEIKELRAAGGDVVPPGGLEGFGDIASVVAERELEGKHAFGAHFVEVTVDTVSGEVRVPRMTSVFAAGRIVNPQTARSHFLGGMTMGIGMALHEEGVLDPRTGDYVNHDLAEYHVPTASDIRALEAHWIDEPDPEATRLATKGIGEIGIVGSAAAVANAVWHASGVRVRDLPIRPDKVLLGL